jgi:hypothetical protein
MVTGRRSVRASILMKIFKPHEVDALIPKIEGVFEHMDFCQRRTHHLATSRPALGTHPSVAEIAESARIRSQMEFLLQAVQEDVGLIGRMGGVVKDLGAGLVDFPGRVQAQDVWLCWKRGEKQVHFWHALDAGFAQRRVLERSENRPSITH